jgi:hypothetical protein
MAEVKPIASAVGAYEAQVINMTGAYNQLLKMQAQQAKNIEAMRKKAEDDLSSLLRDKRSVRGQDSPYIDSLYKDVQDYYNQNRDAISSSTSARNKLYDKINNTIRETNRAVRTKEQGVELNRLYVDFTKPGSVMTSKEFNSRYAMFNRPINDTQRMDYRFTNENGVSVGIDELSPIDLNAVAIYNESKLSERIKNAQTYNVQKEFFRKKGAKDVTQTWSFKDPMAIYNTVESVFVDYPETAADSYKKMVDFKKAEFQSTGVNFQDEVNEDLKSVIQVYKDADIQLPVNIETIFSKDGVAGVNIDNPLEYATFRAIQSTLPQYLGESYSYKTQQLWISQSHLNLQKSANALAWQRYKDSKSNDNLDDFFKNDIKSAIKSGKLGAVAKDWEASLNSVMANPSGQTGIIPAKFSINDKSITVTTQAPLLDADGNYIRTKEAADAAVMKGGKKIGQVIALAGGYYAVEQTYTRGMDPNAADFSTGISDLLNIAEESQVNKTTSEFLGKIRNGNTKGVLNDLLKK